MPITKEKLAAEIAALRARVKVLDGDDADTLHRDCLAALKDIGERDAIANQN